MKTQLAIVTIILGVSMVHAPARAESPAAETPWLRLDSEPPASTARLFAPGLISTYTDDWKIAFPPAGDEVFFTVTGRAQPAIVGMRFRGGQWQEPQVLSFSGLQSDMAPTLSHDGQRMIFVSYRPTSDEDESRDANLWEVRRSGNDWGEPFALSPAINREVEHETWPCLADNGDLYFAAKREDSVGETDIYVSRLVAGVYQDAENLGAPLNSALGEYCPFIAPDGRYLIVEIVDGPDGLGDGDLYLSQRQTDGSWSEPRNMGEAFNSRSHDCYPSLSPDGRQLFFQSDRRVRLPREQKRLSYCEIKEQARMGGGWDIYWIGIDAVEALLR
jgi:WD40-like Beta Propeller Repeat